MSIFALSNTFAVTCSIWWARCRCQLKCTLWNPADESRLYVIFRLYKKNSDDLVSFEGLGQLKCLPNLASHRRPVVTRRHPFVLQKCLSSRTALYEVVPPSMCASAGALNNPGHLAMFPRVLQPCGVATYPSCTRACPALELCYCSVSRNAGPDFCCFSSSYFGF